MSLPALHTRVNDDLRRANEPSTSGNELSGTSMIGEHCRAYHSVWTALRDAVLQAPFREADKERRMQASAVELLEFIGLADKRGAKASDLSYGEQRKLELARALATRPKLLLLDEPAAGMLSHFAIFSIAYLLIDDITYGWLAINIWHNAQYILFVWMFNTRRFKDGIDPEARFLSYLSQPHRLWLYLLTSVAITGVIYWAILGTLSAVLLAGLSATIVLYQIVNFHHYIVDSVIWKVRKPSIRQILGLAS